MCARPGGRDGHRLREHDRGHPGAERDQQGLRSASNGDTLRIHNGTYRESFTINKRVTLNGVGGRPVIDAQCDHRATMQVFHDGVTLNHLKVTGAAENPSGPYPSEVDVENVATGTIHDVVVHDTCGDIHHGAEYGINVFSSGPVEVSNDQATGGFSDAGIYIGGITDTGSGALRSRTTTPTSTTRGSSSRTLRAG